jgi:hypothetical protein
VIAAPALDGHPVLLFVKIKVVEPTDTPVTIPLLFTLAIAGLLLVQVPPVFGDNCEVVPLHIFVGPTTEIVGFGFIVIAEVAFDAHPVVLFVKVNVELPALTAVTTPAFVTVATAGLLLVQVPPEVGDKVVVLFIHIAVGPVTLTTGLPLTVTADVANDIQPVAVLVNVKVADPALTPVTMPAFVTEAMDELLLDQVPPVLGDKVVVVPIQILGGPVTLTVGFGWTTNANVASILHEPAFVL